MPSRKPDKHRDRSRLARWAPWAPALAWAYLLLGRGRYWSAATGLPPSERAGPEQWPPVAVVVPARDEAALLPQTLPSLLGQDYPGHAWIVLVDDQSTDGTATLARSLAAGGGGRGLGLRIVDGAPRPTGWAGKPWAMAQGVRDALSGPDVPQWVLFTDADIHHPRSSLRDLVESAIAGNRAGVSLMARLSTDTAWERLLMPAFVYFFGQLYPFEWVNDKRRRTAAAAGGCMLVNVDALGQAGGIEAIAASTIDDVALAKALKRAGFDIWLGLAGTDAGPSIADGPGSGNAGARQSAPRVESRRSYARLADIWEMVARNAYTQLRHNPVAVAGTVAALSSIYLAPPLLTAAGVATRRPSIAVAGLTAWTAMAATYLPMARYYQVAPSTAIALPFTSLLYTAMTVDSARRHRKGGVPWKGRPHP